MVAAGAIFWAVADGGGAGDAPNDQILVGEAGGARYTEGDLNEIRKSLGLPEATTMPYPTAMMEEATATPTARAAEVESGAPIPTAMAMSEADTRSHRDGDGSISTHSHRDGDGGNINSCPRGEAGPPGPRGPAGDQGEAGTSTYPTAVAQPTALPSPTSTPVAISSQATPQGGAPRATSFQDYMRERFVSASVDNVSTFSLDTDRTSYHLALNWARAGYEVDPDSVRAEEWINAFDYNYKRPLRNDSFAISSDVVRHPLDNRMHLARIAFQAPEMDYDATPVNVTLVLDASGSMSNGNRVEIAREAAESIRRSLRANDRIAVVQFSDDVLGEYTVDHRHPDDPAVARSISRLAPNNSTNVQAGLDRGVRLADRARRENPDAYNYIILMSDGVANVDATDPFAILEAAGDHDSENPLRLITIGVGIENYNDYLLEQLAQHGNGWYRYLSDTGQARATFSRENWLALSIPFADQTRAQVTWDPDVVDTWRIVGYENRITSDQSFAEARREFAEIPAGAATTVFYELELKNPGFAGPLKLGDVELRWVTPSSGESNRQHASITGQDNIQFGTVNDPLLRLGAVIALSSDRYSSLPFVDSSSPSVHQDLLYMVEELRFLDGSLGHLGAYQDLAFLMEHITRNSREAVQPSGYSP